jgi:hypothetical protein
MIEELRKARNKRFGSDVAGTLGLLQAAPLSVAIQRYLERHADGGLL